MEIAIQNVDTDAEYRAALANCATYTVYDTCTIEVTGPFVVDVGGGDPTYAGAANLTIVGTGAQHAITDSGGYVTFLIATGASTITVENLAFSGFQSLETGGAVVNVAGPDLVLQDVLMDSNEALGFSFQSSQGGAVRSTTGDLWVYDSTFTNNANNSGYVDSYGGAIYSNTGNVVIERSAFTGNFTDRRGGAVLSWAGAVTIEDSTFSDNQAENGGAIFVQHGTLGITGSTFEDNIGGYGHAVSVQNSSAVIVNSTFTGDGIGQGVTMAAYESSVELTHNTMTGNSNTLYGIHLIADTSTYTLRANVLAAPATGSSCVADSGGIYVSAGYNWATDTECVSGTDPTDVTDGTDPMLDALADNGGATATQLPSWTSPLRDAIPLSETAPPTDQRGVARAQGEGFDIGAVEVAIPSVTFAVYNNTADAVAEFTVDGATSVDEVEWFAISGYTPVAPAGVARPLGIMGFELTVPAPGESVTVTAALPQPVTQVWKDVNGTWVRVTDAVIVGTTVTYVLVDGGPLDSDGAANGVIVDPVLFGVGASFTG